MTILNFHLVQISDSDEPGEAVLTGMQNAGYECVTLSLLPDGEPGDFSWFGTPRDEQGRLPPLSSYFLTAPPPAHRTWDSPWQLVCPPRRDRLCPQTGSPTAPSVPGQVNPHLTQKKPQKTATEEKTDVTRTKKQQKEQKEQRQQPAVCQSDQRHQSKKHGSRSLSP